MREGVLILGGPTASGKTSFALDLAELYNAEIVGADSRQVYLGMPIGTAAPTAEQLARVPHHLVGFVDPYERYSAARFVVDAAAAIADIRSRGKRALVVGGTGFYLRALCGEVDLAREPDPALRERIARESRTHPVEVLHAWLRSRNPGRAGSISARDPYRVSRALEVDLGRTAGARPDPGQRRALPTLRAAGIPFLKVALLADPAQLARRIAERTDAMIAGGLLQEAELIGSAAVAGDAVGYREALAYQNGWLTFEELRATLTRATRRYAKRQLTWFRSEQNLLPVEPGDLDAIAPALEGIGWPPAP